MSTWRCIVPSFAWFQTFFPVLIHLQVAVGASTKFSNLINTRINIRMHKWKETFIEWPDMPGALY